MALVIVLSAFNGLSDLVESLYNSFDPDIEITIKEGKTFTSNSIEFEKIKNLKSINYFVEVLEGNALLKFDEKQKVSIIKGVSKNFKQMSHFDTLIVNGSFNLENNNIVIGQGISNVLQIRAGNEFTPLSIYAPKRGPQNSINTEDGLNEMKMYVTGDFGISDEFDHQYSFTSIDNARKLLDYTNEVTSVEIAVNEKNKINEVKAELEKILGNNYDVKNREEQNAILFKTLKSEKLWTFIILLFILIIATFNVIGSLTMLIIEKKKDITILHNMGADIKLIRKIFLTEGLMITLFGAFLGLAIGALVCWIQIQFSVIGFSEGYVIDAYPVTMKSIDFLLIFIAVILIGLFAAWYPVRVFTKRHLNF